MEIKRQKNCQRLFEGKVDISTSLTRNVIFAVTHEVRVKGQNTESTKLKTGGRGGWCSRCSSVKNNNNPIKAEQTDLHQTKYCYKTQQ